MVFYLYNLGKVTTFPIPNRRPYTTLGCLWTRVLSPKDFKVLFHSKVYFIRSSVRRGDQRVSCTIKVISEEWGLKLEV